MANRNKSQVKSTKPLCLKKRVGSEITTVNKMEYKQIEDVDRILETPSSFKIEKPLYNDELESSKDDLIQERKYEIENVFKSAANTLDSNTIDGSMKLSENPFDIFNGKLIQKKAPVKTQTESIIPTATDNFLLSGLRSSSVPSKRVKYQKKIGIFSQITVRSKISLTISPKKYYKFPFDIALINDESALYNTMSRCLAVALSSAYSNFRRFGEQFKVLAGADMFTFSNDITCSLSSAKLLNENGIEYTVGSSDIKIEIGDAKLVYDVLMNLEIPRGKPLPFLISPFEFEGGIMCRTKVIKGPMVRNRESIEYMYTVIGPLDSYDFEFDECVDVLYS